MMTISLCYLIKGCNLLSLPFDRQAKFTTDLQPEFVLSFGLDDDEDKLMMQLIELFGKGFKSEVHNCGINLFYLEKRVERST